MSWQCRDDVLLNHICLFKYVLYYFDYENPTNGNHNNFHSFNHPQRLYVSYHNLFRKLQSLLVFFHCIHKSTMVLFEANIFHLSTRSLSVWKGILIDHVICHNWYDLVQRLQLYVELKLHDQDFEYHKSFSIVINF